MRLPSLVVKEMVRRRVGLILSIVAVVVASGAYVGVQTISVSAQDTLRKLSLQLGKNILIIPAGWPYEDYLTGDFGPETFPEDLVQGVAQTPEVVADHYLGKLQRTTVLDGMAVILTGIKREIGAAGRVKQQRGQPLEGFDVSDPTKAVLGYRVAQRLGKKVGDPLSLEGRTFTVANVRPQQGTVEDKRVFIALARMQEMFNQPGRINAIDAIGCTCPTVALNVQMTYIRDTLQAQANRLAQARNIPAPQVIMIRDKFEMRQKSREMMRTMGLAVSAVLLVLCGLGIALYMYTNIADRRYEVAVLLALGHRPACTVAALLAKVLVVALVGGVLGFLAGVGAAVAAGPSIAAVDHIAPVWGLWWQALVFALAVCLAAAVIAVWGALRVDPAQLLRNQ